MLAAHHGRDQIQKLTLAARRDGTVTGLKVELLADMGAYLRLGSPVVPILGAFMFNGIYKFGSYHFTCTNVFTNKVPTDAYRGAGRPEATFAVERMMDELAAELSRDPLELRAQNWITHEEFPFHTVAGLTYDSGNYEAATAQARELFDYDGLRREQAERRERRDPVQLGIGVSTFTEMCGLAPSRILGGLGTAARGWEHAAIRMLPTGKVEVVTGSSAHGQGHETAWSQIIADQLGVPFDDVEVLHGDTQTSPRGMDTYGSRSLAVGGIAVVKAAEKVIAKARPIAAHLMECAEEDIEFAGGRFRVKGTEKAVGIADVALAVFAATDLPEGIEPNLDSEATYDPENFSFPHGTHLCATEVDTETGQVRIRSYVCVDDVGHVVNPLIVEGQVHGGLAQGIAQALYEEAVHDESGTLLSGSFAYYLVPSAVDLPSFTTGRTETPPPLIRSASRGWVRRAPSRPLRPWSTRCSTRCASSACATSKCLAPQCGSGAPSKPPREVPDDSVEFRLRRPDHHRRGGGGARQGRRGRQGHRRRAEPDADAAAAAGRPDHAGRPRPDRRAARCARGRRRPGHRRDDHLLRPAARSAVAPARAAARGGHPYRRRPADPAPRHAGRSARARGSGG